MIKKYLQNNLLSFFLNIIFISFFILTIVLAWTEPISSPPGGNVSAPLNVGPTGQIKSGGLILNTGGAQIGLIVATGSVGIGTTTPQGKLDVVGGFVRSDTGFCIGTSCITSWPGGGGVSGSGTTNYIAKWTGSTSLGNSIIYDNGTNVGIGTTAPGQKLTVAGNIDVTGNRILNLATPINASDAATKGYVDTQVANARPANWDCVLVSAYTAPDGTAPTAYCPAGYKLIAGGCQMNVFEPDIAGGSYFPWVSRPANNGWYCSNDVGWGEWAYAWCCR